MSNPNAPSQVDADGDGVVTAEEMAALDADGDGDVDASDLAKLDADGDGVITADEVARGLDADGGGVPDGHQQQQAATGYGPPIPPTQPGSLTNWQGDLYVAVPHFSSPKLPPLKNAPQLVWTPAPILVPKRPLKRNGGK